MSTKETETLSLWQRFKKTAITIVVIVSIFFSFKANIDLETFKKNVGPIGTNPPQYTPSRFMVAELGSEHLHPPVNWLTDTIIGHNDSSNMFSKLGTVNDIRTGLVTSSGLTGTLANYTTNSSLATTLSSYALISSLANYVPTSRTITINGTTFDLSANRSWTIPVNTYSAGSGLSLSSTTFSLALKTVNNNPGRSIVTTAAAANGFQISSTKDAEVSYSPVITCNVQIGLVTNVEGYVALEIAATNSTTAGDWKEIARVTNGQNISLAIALASIQKQGGAVSGTVPAGWYARLRSVNVAGTPTYSIASQQESY